VWWAILATKADNAEGDHSLNYTTAKLAYEFDLPLWNFWRAAQDLPNQGMDSYRDDGFYISYEAWTERRFTALRTLDVEEYAVGVAGNELKTPNKRMENISIFIGY